MKTIIISEQDPAGLLMKKILVEEKGFKETGKMYADYPILALNGNELITIKEDQIYADLREIETDLFIFASKHAAESGRPTLTVHPCGNWGKAEYGGIDSYLPPTNASAMKVALLALKAYQEANNIKYDVSYEQTHHGPYLEKPQIWVELGSKPADWQDEKGARACVEAIMQVLENEREFPAAIGIGGQHYPQKFTQLALDTDWAFGHMCPKWALESLTKKSLEHAIEQTQERVVKIFYEKKGLGTEKQRIMKFLEEFNSESV
ncbi:MAG: D-tyrosyl-tRNA(Tyr) deacylase [Candidatus Diapherotrites archaeon]|nr:D-tyrosyl-tRNA(Tyr) deacylase [Candidatus Diapherotrites archaeon]